MTLAKGSWLDRVVTRGRVRRFSVAILVVNAALYAYVVARGKFPFDAQGTAILPDFMAHLSGGVLVAAGRGRELYDIGAQYQIELGITHDPKYLDIFISPPLAAYLYAPFSACSYAVATIAWTAASCGLLALSLRLLGRLAPSVSIPDRTVLFIAFAASQPVIQLLGSGQDTAVSLLLWVAGVRLALERRDASSGLVFSLGLFKPQLFMFPPLLFLLLRRRASLVGWAAGAFAQIGVTLALFGPEGILGWGRILRSPEYLVSLRSGRALRMASVIPFVRSIAPESWSAAAAVVGVMASLVIAAVTIWRSAPRSNRAALDERGVWALACTGTLLVTPHLFSYDLALLVLPVALLLEMKGSLSRAIRNSLLALSLLTWTAAARVGFEVSAWPTRVLAASWTAIPLFFFWRAIPTRVLISPAETPASLRPAS